MYYPSPSPAYFQHLESRLQQLEEENKRLNEKLQEIKPLNIENINYKIQELTVQELKGTLNIGMTALTDPEEIKKWLNETREGEDIQMNEMEHPPPEEKNSTGEEQ